jgi:hypothetical protein
MWIMEEYRGPFTEPRLRSLYLNRRMISDGLGRLLPDETEEGTPENYRKRHSLITEYARSPGCEQHLAVRFVRQELAEAREGTVLVDFAYWGTMPVFVQALMPAKRFEVAWFIGPPGSPARFHHNSSEGPANSGERFIILDYRADRLVEENGMITPERLSEPGSAEFHEKRTALIEYALEWRATRSSTATNK